MLSQDYPTIRPIGKELNNSGPVSATLLNKIAAGWRRLAVRLWNGYVEQAGRHVYYNEQGYTCGWLYWY